MDKNESSQGAFPQNLPQSVDRNQGSDSKHTGYKKKQVEIDLFPKRRGGQNTKKRKRQIIPAAITTQAGDMPCMVSVAHNNKVIDRMTVNFFSLPEKAIGAALEIFSFKQIRAGKITLAKK